MHVPHWQASPHVCVPPLPHACMAPGAHAPWFMHAENAPQTPFSQVRVWVPQWPQLWLAGPVQLWLMHADHWQAALHTCVPDIPQAWVAPGVQPMATQLPGAAGVAQLSHVPPQARSQHTPDAQTSGARQSPFS